MNVNMAIPCMGLHYRRGEVGGVKLRHPELYKG